MPAGGGKLVVSDCPHLYIGGRYRVDARGRGVGLDHGERADHSHSGGPAFPSRHGRQGPRRERAGFSRSKACSNTSAHTGAAHAGAHSRAYATADTRTNTAAHADPNSTTATDARADSRANSPTNAGPATSSGQSGPRLDERAVPSRATGNPADRRECSLRREERRRQWGDAGTER